MGKFKTLPTLLKLKNRRKIASYFYEFIFYFLFFTACFGQIGCVLKLSEKKFKVKNRFSVPQNNQTPLPQNLYAFSTLQKTHAYFNPQKNSIFLCLKEKNYVLTNKTGAEIQYIHFTKNAILGFSIEDEDTLSLFKVVLKGNDASEKSSLNLIESIHASELNMSSFSKKDFSKSHAKHYSKWGQSQTLFLLPFHPNIYLLHLNLNNQVDIYPISLKTLKNNDEVFHNVYLSKQPEKIYLTFHLYEENIYQGVRIISYNYLERKVENEKNIFKKDKYFFGFANNQAIFTSFELKTKKITFDYHLAPRFEKTHQKTFEISSEYPINFSFRNDFLEGIFVGSNHLHVHQWE